MKVFFNRENLLLIHVASLTVLATWYLGGASQASQAALCYWGSLGAVFLGIEIASRWREGGAAGRKLWVLWPYAAFTALILVSLSRPSFRLAEIEGISVYAPITVPTWLPSSARTDLSAQQLWLWDVAFLAGLNLWLGVRSRRKLTRFLVFVAANALALAIFGTLQRLVASPGLFFGAIVSPNKSFFASFIYHNHWGAYILLALAISSGVTFALSRENEYRDIWHSPAPIAIVGILILFGTLPLCGSRSATLLSLALLLGAGGDLARRIRRMQTTANSARVSPAALILLALLTLTGLAGAISLAHPVIAERASDTRQQLDWMHAQHSLGSRALLYHDTWRMAADRPWFGWGLGTYPVVFTHYNSQSVAADHLPIYFADAHSDWLQLLSETGYVGVCLLCVCLLLPLRRLPGFKEIRTLPKYLLGGCVLVLLYASFEFPFGNPAVLILFWITLSVAVRWQELSLPTPR